mmetsp:Transcript_17142/g.36325  ORF Transcript_17142/g.36325 Transcript_17142/m.36325 type:complete len:230 (-) Transcript_17142:693-1382(-)
MNQARPKDHRPKGVHELPPSLLSMPRQLQHIPSGRRFSLHCIAAVVGTLDEAVLLLGGPLMPGHEHGERLALLEAHHQGVGGHPGVVDLRHYDPGASQLRPQGAQVPGLDTEVCLGVQEGGELAHRERSAQTLKAEDIGDLGEGLQDLEVELHATAHPRVDNLHSDLARLDRFGQRASSTAGAAREGPPQPGQGQAGEQASLGLSLCLAVLLNVLGEDEEPGVDLGHAP